MYNLDPINQQARPNTVYVEGLSAAARIAPEQGRLLGLRAVKLLTASLPSALRAMCCCSTTRRYRCHRTWVRWVSALGLQVLMLGGNLIARRLTSQKPAIPSARKCRRVRVPRG